MDDWATLATLVSNCLLFESTLIETLQPFYSVAVVSTLCMAFSGIGTKAAEATPQQLTDISRVRTHALCELTCLT